MLREELQRALKSLDYRALRFQNTSPQNPLEAYVLGRAHLVAGELSDFKKFTARHSKLLSDHHYLPLLEAQAASMHYAADLEQHFAPLSALSAHFGTSHYLKGEIHFSQAFLHFQQAEFKRSLPFFDLAIQEYDAAGLGQHKALCLFNQVIACNHLNLKNLYVEKFSQLQEHHQAAPTPLTELFTKLLRAHERIDQEDFALAQRDLGQVIELCQELGRFSQLFPNLITQAYVALKQQDLLRFAQVEERFRKLDAPTTQPHLWAVLVEMKVLAEKAFTDREEVARFFAKWEKKKFHHVAYVFLADLLLELLLKSSDYPSLAHFARRSQRHCLKTQQALRLVDFRYYEIVARLRQGETESLEPLVAAFKSEAQLEGALGRLTRLDDEFKACRTSLHPAAPKKNEWVLDLAQSRIRCGERTTDLARLPMIENFLRILAQYPQGLSVAKFFELLYKTSFHPLRHENRFNSLLDRGRKLLGSPRHIVRQRGKIFLSPAVQLRLKNTTTPYPENRKNLIIDFIRSHPLPRSISDLERSFQAYSRRTLQKDLKELVDRGLLNRCGTKKACLYSVRATEEPT